jgi:membrane associated rhomboid family serine protease
MILLPYGHEQTTVRRLPWVTITLMGICLAAFILSGRWNLVPKEDWAVQEDVFAAMEYYSEHSYLELNEEFKETFLSSVGDEEMMEVLGALAEVNRSKPTRRVRQAEQEHLDTIAARAVASFQNHTLRRWGLVPKERNPVGWLTHMFLHAGWMHLIGNLFILFLAGPFIEDVWGRPLFLGFYLASGLIAAFFHILSDPDSISPMIGASGAIAGVMGAFLIRYGTTKIKFFYFFLLIRGTFRAPAWLMIPLWFVSQVWMALLTSELDLQAGVAYWAHVGGFVAGVGTAWFIDSKRIEERFIHKNIQDKITLKVEDNEAVLEALSVRESDPEQAFRMLTLTVMNQPAHHDGAAALWDVARYLGRTDETAPLMLRSIGHQLRSGDKDLALEQWLDVQRDVVQIQGDPRVLVRLAQELQSRERREDAVATVRMALQTGGSGLEPTLALTIARIARETDSGTARAAAEHVLARPDADPEVRWAAEKLVDELPPDLSSISLSPEL